MDQEEIWELLDEFPDYEVSSLGRIRLIKNGQLIMQSPNGTGAMKINVRKEGKNYIRSVGRLVCRKFNGDPKEGDVVMYADDDWRNVAADNLYWKDRGFAREWASQRKRTRPLINRPILQVATGIMYTDSLEAARMVNGIEKYIVLCTDDPSCRRYKRSSWEVV